MFHLSISGNLGFTEVFWPHKGMWWLKRHIFSICLGAHFINVGKELHVLEKVMTYVLSTSFVA